MTNNIKRPLEAIADDIRALERGNAFAIGALLTEARDDAGYGEWATWLEEEFDWSEDTARNYMAAHRLADKFRTVRNLKLPMRAVYRLGNEFELDGPELPIIIEALVRAAKGKTKVISVGEAEGVIDMTLLRIEHGDYPEATLNALNSLRGLEEPWVESAITTLKAERPTNELAVLQIESEARRAHLASLYASVGGLPDDVPDDAYWPLETVREELRGEVLQKLKVAARPLTEEAIRDCINTLVSDYAEKKLRQEEEQRTIKEVADKATARGAEKTARRNRNAQQDPGADSPDEIARKLARLEALEPRVSMLERVKLALESENEELRAAKPVRPSLIEALETALDLAREAARHDGGLSSGKAKKREKALTEIRSGLALLIQLEQKAPPPAVAAKDANADGLDILPHLREAAEARAKARAAAS